MKYTIKKIGSIMLIVVIALSSSGCSLFKKDFAASAYVKGNLDRKFKGETKELVKIVENIDEKELVKAYNEDVSAFVSDVILKDIKTSQETEEQYEKLSKKIFAAMKYSVKEAEKVSNKEYKVKVEYEPSDIIHLFSENMTQRTNGIIEKAQNGEYQGTEEEIKILIEKEIVAEAYIALEDAYKNITYRNKKTVTLNVVSDDEKVFYIKDKEISDLFTKILCLDEIQG